MVNHRACIFGSVLDLCWGYTHTWNYADMGNILNKTLFKYFHILYFPPMHKVLWDTHYNATHSYRDTQTDTEYFNTCIAVTDPRFHIGGTNLMGGRQLLRGVHFKKFVCQNERIWTLGGARRRRSLDPPLYRTLLFAEWQMSSDPSGPMLFTCQMPNKQIHMETYFFLFHTTFWINR